MSRQQSESDSQYNDVINKLQYYMLNENTIKQSLHSRISNVEPPNKIFPPVLENKAIQPDEVKEETKEDEETL